MADLSPEASGAYLRALLGEPYTDEQLAIATHPLMPQLVVAGAGSGKTAVMAARVVHLVAHHGVEPGQVLGLTFTNKAAAELSERVRRALHRLPGRANALDGAAADDLPTVATYHAYAATIVRDHALRIGREPLTQLLTEATRWQLALRVVRRAKGPFAHLTLTPSFVAQRLLALDGELAEHLVAPDAVRARDALLLKEYAALTKTTNPVHDCAEAARARGELLELVEAYRAEKHRLDLIDFGDQVALAAEIATRSAEVGRIERDRFRVVVLDEYQDTGVAQRVLLQHLFGEGHPVTAVGDPNQAIYGWRGASVGNLIGFGEHFEHGGSRAIPMPLMTSFRCGGRILYVANAIAEPLHERALARGRRMLDVRALGPRDGAEDAGEVVVSLHTTTEDEARWLAGQLVAAHEAGTLWREAAVLCRRRVDFALLQRTLVEHDVPVEVVGLGGLLEMPEVADVVAALRVLVDPVANAALVRILTGPRWRIGPRDLARLGRRADRLARFGEQDDSADPASPADPLVKATEGVDPVDVASLSDALDSPGAPDAYSPEAVERFGVLRAELRGLRPLVSQPIVEVVATVIRQTGLGVEVESDTAAMAAARAANLAAFLDHAAHFTGLDGESDLRAFLAYLDAAADAEEGLDVGGVSAADTVKLLTVHKAKGLEWDVVALPALSAGVFPSGRGRSIWTKSAHVLPYALRGDAHDLPNDPPLSNVGLDGFGRECKADDADEERRLLYVALTRARSLVVASGAWWSGTRSTPAGPSAFLTELRALAGVREDEWVSEAPDANPLAADKLADVSWPLPYADDAVARRQAGAALVRAAQAGGVEPAALTFDEAETVAQWEAESDVLLDELLSQVGGERLVPLPRRLTASQVVALAQNPNELARQLARPMPSRPVREARRGTRFHAWVESLWGDRPLLEPDEMPGAADDPDLDDTSLVDLQQRFLASEYGDRRPAAIEAPFELVVGGRLLRGRIDAVYDTADGGFDVIDYKTGEVPADFAAAALQLAIYRLAWAGIAGVDPARVTAGFFYVRTGLVKRPDHLLSTDELAALLSE